MPDRLTLEDLSQLCRTLEAEAKSLAEWTKWGALATETKPGERSVYVPGCLDAEVLQQRGRDLLAAAQAVLDGTAVRPDPAEEALRETLINFPIGAELEDDAEDFGLEVKHWYVGFYTGQVPESIEAAYGEVLNVFSDPTLLHWQILSPNVEAIEADLAAYPEDNWAGYPTLTGETKQEKAISLFAAREKWFCTEMIHDVLGPVFAFYGEWSGAEAFYWVPNHGVVQGYSPN